MSSVHDCTCKSCVDSTCSASDAGAGAVPVMLEKGARWT